MQDYTPGGKIRLTPPHKINKYRQCQITNKLMDITLLKISHSEIIIARYNLQEQHYFKINITRNIAVITLMLK